ncbi:Uncharacterised protein [Gardnerella vaginalis]|nr:hypothetical protein SAMN04488545_0803 [Gardnerella vaginalis]VEH17282.1 Uncharacterised protein [Gardnerella vaginalis]
MSLEHSMLTILTNYLFVVKTKKYTNTCVYIGMKSLLRIMVIMVIMPSAYVLQLATMVERVQYSLL